jgi:MFS family permease
MRGRVLSLYGMIFRATPAFGAVLMGAAADLVGMRWPMIATCVVVALLIVLGWSRMTRETPLSPTPTGDGREG